MLAGQKAQFAQAGGQVRWTRDLGDDGIDVPRQLRQVEMGPKFAGGFAEFHAIIRRELFRLLKICLICQIIVIYS